MRSYFTPQMEFCLLVRDARAMMYAKTNRHVRIPTHEPPLIVPVSHVHDMPVGSAVPSRVSMLILHTQANPYNTTQF